MEAESGHSLFTFTFHFSRSHFTFHVHVSQSNFIDQMQILSLNDDLMFSEHVYILSVGIRRHSQGIEEIMLSPAPTTIRSPKVT